MVMENRKVDAKMDLRGVSCPLNYVKTKLKLEEIAAGQIGNLKANSTSKYPQGRRKTGRLEV